MEETKWLTKGKIIAMVVILIIIATITTFIFIHRNNLKKDYIKFENQLQYAAPNYLLKEKIVLMENEWREIGLKDIMAQKLVINKKAEDCIGYVIAEAHENIPNENEVKEDITDKDETDKTSVETNEEKPKKNVSNNITYKAYVSCKKIYKTEGYGKKPSNKVENNKETQTQKDTEKPVIELFGDEEIKIKVGEKYTEPGAIATDNVDGDITSKIKITGKVDTTKIGKYTIKYTIVDSSNNKSIKQRYVIVEKKDEETTKPETEVQTPSKEPEETQKPDLQEPTPTPTAPVVDTINPVIMFNDNSLYQTICTGNKVDISTGGAYGYIARDNIDGNITNRVKITGDTGIISKSGVYNLYYEVSDNAGNKATATKQFSVKSCSNTIPSTSVKIPVDALIITPNTTLTMNKGEKYTLYVTITPSNATDKTITYKSSNPSVASVSETGVITALQSGTTDIIATSSNDKTAKRTIKVE